MTITVPIAFGRSGIPLTILLGFSTKVSSLLDLFIVPEQLSKFRVASKPKDYIPWDLGGGQNASSFRVPQPSE